MAYSKVNITSTNVMDFVEFSEKLKSDGIKKTKALKLIQEHFNCSAATARKVYDMDDDVKYLMNNQDHQQTLDSLVTNSSVDETDNLQDSVQEDDISPLGYEETFSGKLNVVRKVGRDTLETISNEEFNKGTLRTLVDMFYQAQDRRIAVAGQLRALEKNYDTSISKSETLKWLLDAVAEEEKGLGAILNEVTANDPVCIWLRKIKGIGSIYAAGLRAMLDVTKANYATGFISFAGLNDQNCPWLSKEKFYSLAKELSDKLGIPYKAVTVPFMEELAVATGRKYSKVLFKATHRWNAKDRVFVELPKPDFDVLQRNMCMVPYNQRLKTLMFKIADRWNKMSSNHASLYTMIMLDRKALETRRNNNCEYAEQAARALREKNYTDKATIETLKSGRLPKGQIQLRAYRVANTVFLSHVFDAMFIYHYGKYPPRYYALEQLGHRDEIFPEVPYTELFDTYEQRTGRKADRRRKSPDIDITGDNAFTRIERMVKRDYTVDQYIADIEANQ